MELTKFDQKTHVYGRIWTVLALLVILSVPTAISIHLQAFPPIKVVLAGLAPVLMLYVPTGFVEVALYVPMIGPGATYLAFVTGNINNLKMPCSIATLSTNKVSIQSEEGEVLSTLAVGASSCCSRRCCRILPPSDRRLHRPLRRSSRRCSVP